MQDIRLGTLVNVNDKTENYVRQIIPYGFESFSFIFSGGFPRKPFSAAASPASPPNSPKRSCPS